MNQRKSIGYKDHEERQRDRVLKKNKSKNDGSLNAATVVE
jgi:hypothetical protein